MKETTMHDNTVSPTLPDWIRVSNAVEIEDVRLAAFQAYCRQEDVGGAMAVEMTTDTAAVGDTAEAKLRVLATFTFNAMPEAAAAGGEAVVTINCVVQLTYGCPNIAEHSDAALQDFAQKNGIYNAYPYWREFVQNSIARLGLPTLVLPSFHLDMGKRDAAPPRKAKGAKMTKRPVKKLNSAKAGGKNVAKNKVAKKKVAKKK